MARSVTRGVVRGAAVLAVVGALLPFLFWLLAEEEPDLRDRAGSASAAVGQTQEAFAPAEAPPLGLPAASIAPVPPASRPAARPVADAGAPAPFDLEAMIAGTDTPSGIPAHVEVATVETATLTGRVVGPSGEPIAGAGVSLGSSFVSCWGGERVEPEATARTGADGTFRLEVVTGQQLLQITAPRDTDYLPAASLVEVKAPSTDAGSIRMLIGGRLEGRVLDVEGRPMGGVDVGLQSDGAATLAWGGHVVILEQPGSSSIVDEEPTTSYRGLVVDSALPARTARSGPDGRYVLRGVPPGMHTLVGRHSRAVGRRDGVEVGSGRVRAGVDLVLEHGPRLEVVVRDETGGPVEGVAITANDEEGGMQTVTSDAQGRAAFQPFAGRRLDVYANSPHHVANSANLSAQRGEAALSLELMLQRAARLRVTGAHLYLRRQGAEGTYLQPARVQGEEAEFDSLAPGVYDLLSIGPNGGWFVHSEGLRLVAGEERALGRIEPRELPGLRLVVLDASGRPCVGATVACERNLGLVGGSTDAEGAVWLTLPPGRFPLVIIPTTQGAHRVEVGGGGTQTVVLPPSKARLVIVGEGSHYLSLRDPESGQLVLQASSADRSPLGVPRPGRYLLDVDGYRYGVVELREGETLEVPVVAPAGVEVRARVVDEEGRPLHGASVMLTSEDPWQPGYGLGYSTGRSWSGRSDAEGQLKIQVDVGPAADTLHATVVSRGRTFQFRLPVAAGKPVTQTFVLPERVATTRLVVEAPTLRPGDSLWIEPEAAPAGRLQRLVVGGTRTLSFDGVAPGTYRLKHEGSAGRGLLVEVPASGAQIRYAP